jgi:hypothetical protein
VGLAQRRDSLLASLVFFHQTQEVEQVELNARRDYHEVIDLVSELGKACHVEPIAREPIAAHGDGLAKLLQVKNVDVHFLARAFVIASGAPA